MYDQRRTARFESVLPANTYARTSPYSLLTPRQAADREFMGGRGQKGGKNNIRKRSPTNPKRVGGRAVGAQRFRDADPMLSDGATGSCYYALLLRRAARQCWWWRLRCCAPCRRGKELANSLLVGLQLAAGAMGDGVESSFWKGGVVHAVDWKGCSCFSLCAGVCVFRAVMVLCSATMIPSFFLSEKLTTVYRHPNLVSRVD